MATPRYLYGDANPQLIAVATDKAVDKHDLVGLTSDTLTRAEDETWGTAIATATAPTLADVALAFGSGLTNAATDVKVSYNTPWGEGTLSSATAVTPTANGGIEVAGIALPANVLSLNVYVEDAAGSDVYKLYRVTGGEQFVITGYGVGRVPPTAVATGALEVTQYTFAQKFVGASAQSKTNAQVRPYGNSADNLIRVDTDGVFEYDCASATFEVGDFVGPAKDTGNALLSDKLVEVAAEPLSIGKVVERGTSITRVKVRIHSKKMNASRGQY